MPRQLTAAEELYFDAEAHAGDADAAAEDAADSGALIEQYYQMSIAAVMRDICRDLDDLTLPQRSSSCWAFSNSSTAAFT